MKLKSIFILLVIVMTVFSIESSYSQGFFQNNTLDTEESTRIENGNLKAPGAGTLNDQQNPLAAPVGEGLVILSLLSGGYFIIKKKNLQKN